MNDSFLDPAPIAAAHRDQPVAKADAVDVAVSRQAPPPIVVGRGEGVTMFAKNTPLICIKQLPLPGIVI
ncbi:hypothetical protein NX871_31580, partial [Burkholderia thailandensis]|uniref:hypothetical protein n=1 Tax=Burkholderia thailandensis TaxID=57975 RepID=UPI00217DF7FA